MNDLYSTGDLARMFGIPRDTITNLMKSGLPSPSRRVAGRRVFTREDAEAVSRWLDAHGKAHRKINEPVAV